MKARVKISVIILIHNKVEMTRRCLESLAGAIAYSDHEVLLLDNGSSEDISSLKEYTHFFNKLRIIRSETNLSFSRGNNLCANEAEGEYLLFLNNDVFPDSTCIEQLARPLEQDSSAGVTGGMLLFPGKESVQHAGIQQMLWGFVSNYGVGGEPEDNRLRRAGTTFAVTGAMQCVRKGTFHLVGGYDERYIWGYEDVDLCLKIGSIGQCVVYEPAATAIHFESATLNVMQNRNNPLNYRLYRDTWDPILIPREISYIQSLKDRLGVNAVAIFGVGNAAHGITNILQEHGIHVAGYTSLDTKINSVSFLGKPVVPLESLSGLAIDRLIVASQFYFEIEHNIKTFDPLGDPIFPVLT